MSDDPRVRMYADTSVFGGAFDREFAVATAQLFGLVARGHLRLVTSVPVRDEIGEGPERVKAFFAEVTEGAEIAELTEGSYRLQQRYIEHGVVSARWGTDALHVAIATVSRCPLIVSWNFRHIVSFRRIPLYNAVNVIAGYGPIAIHSPREVVESEEEEEDV